MNWRWRSARWRRNRRKPRWLAAPCSTVIKPEDLTALRDELGGDRHAR